MSRLVQELIKESMTLERAVSLCSALANEAAKRRNEANKGKRRPEDKDESFDLVINVINEARERFRSDSNQLWKQAEERCRLDDDGVENLLNAVIQRAALDYELALSNRGFPDSIREIEEFFRGDADVFTKADVSQVPKRIRMAHRQFVEIAHDHVKDIIKETSDNRKRNRDMLDNTYRCPLCGGGMYEWGKAYNGRHQIRCTGCNLAESVKVK